MPEELSNEVLAERQGTLRHDVDEMHKTMYGNGRVGLYTRVDRLESSIKEVLDSIEDVKVDQRLIRRMLYGMSFAISMGIAAAFFRGFIQ